MELIFKTKRLFSFLSFPIYIVVLYAENIAKITECNWYLCRQKYIKSHLSWNIKIGYSHILKITTC